MEDNSSVNNVLNGSSSKSPIIWLEVPIQKFNAAVPHFVDLLKSHNNCIMKLRRLNQMDEVRKEQMTAARTVTQLKSLISDMDNLRTQVVDSDVSKFDKSIRGSKQQALTALKSFQDLSIEPQSTRSPSEDLEQNKEESNTWDQKLQAVVDVTEEIKQQEQCAASLEALQDEIQEINGLFQDISQLVHEQGESVQRIEDNVEVAHDNVQGGEKMLWQAVKYKQGMYPMWGALLGSVIGGPVGLLAGLKLGSLAAVACGFLGFTGGKILKNQNEATLVEAEQNRQKLST